MNGIDTARVPDPQRGSQLHIRTADCGRPVAEEMHERALAVRALPHLIIR